MLAYVAISSTKTLASFVIEPMTYERPVNQLETSANLQYRLEEEIRLKTDYKQQCNEINKLLSLNKRWDYSHGSLLCNMFTTFHFQIIFV